MAIQETQPWTAAVLSREWVQVCVSVFNASYTPYDSADSNFTPEYYEVVGDGGEKVDVAERLPSPPAMTAENTQAAMQDAESPTDSGESDVLHKADTKEEAEPGAGSTDEAGMHSYSPDESTTQLDVASNNTAGNIEVSGNSTKPEQAAVQRRRLLRTCKLCCGWLHAAC